LVYILNMFGFRSIVWKILNNILINQILKQKVSIDFIGPNILIK